MAANRIYRCMLSKQTFNSGPLMSEYLYPLISEYLCPLVSEYLCPLMSEYLYALSCLNIYAPSCPDSSCLNIYAPSCLPFMSDYLWFHIIWLGGVLQSQWSIMQKYICGRIAWGEVPVTVCYAMAIRKPNMASIVIPWAGSMGNILFSAYVSSPPTPLSSG